MVGVKMGYSNIGIAPGHFSSLEHGIKVLCSSELGVAEVNEQALFATLKKQIPINAIGEIEILNVENCMQKPGHWFFQRNHKSARNRNSERSCCLRTAFPWGVR